jgi:upstream activation factor subunit UAF30
MLSLSSCFSASIASDSYFQKRQLGRTVFWLVSGRDAHNAKSGLDEPRRVSSSNCFHLLLFSLGELPSRTTDNRRRLQTIGVNKTRDKESTYLLHILVYYRNMNPSDLESAIRKILTTPGVDLNSISAKVVRKRLQALVPSMTSEWMKENKKAINAVITKTYQSVNGAASASSSGDTNGVHEEGDVEGVGEEEEEEGDEELGSSPKLPAKKRQKKSGQEKSDAEYARQLSNQLNGRARSSRTTSVGKPKTNAGRKGGPGKRKKPLTADTVNSDEDRSDADSTLGKKRKSRGGGGAKGGFSKEYNLRYGFRQDAAHENTPNLILTAASLWSRCLALRGSRVLRP